MKDHMLHIRIPLHDYEHMKAQAQAAGMSTHAFAKLTLLARLRRLRGEWVPPRPHGALAAELRLKLAAVEAQGARRMTVAVRCDELAAVYRDMLRALEDVHA